MNASRAKTAPSVRSALHVRHRMGALWRLRYKRIYEEIVKLLRLPELRNLIIAQGAEPVGSTPEQLAAFMKSETAKWARVIKEAKIRKE